MKTMTRKTALRQFKTLTPGEQWNVVSKLLRGFIDKGGRIKLVKETRS